PEPQQNLPREHQWKGVSIGDVGSVTPEGIFDFYFNIYLPADDPVNSNDVPGGFSPLTPHYVAKDVLHLDHPPGHYVSTPSVRKLDPEFPSGEFPGGDFVFNCKTQQGAVLTLPHGSHLEKLQNLQNIRRYAAKNVESWYKYINGTRGREIANGSLYLVTGCEKSTSWGMAAFQDVTQNIFHLSFNPTVDTSHDTEDYKYRWIAAGPARTKESDSFPIDTEGGRLNQTLFIHGFSISLGTGIWAKLFKDVEIRQIVDSASGRSNRDFVPYGAQGSSFSWTFSLFGGATQGGNQCGGAEDPDVTMSEFSSLPKLFHPSQAVNDYLLVEFPDATVVLSHDDDWGDEISRHEDNQSTEPHRNERAWLQQICDQFIVVQEDDAIIVSRPHETEEQLVSSPAPYSPPSAFGTPSDSYSTLSSPLPATPDSPFNPISTFIGGSPRHSPGLGPQSIPPDDDLYALPTEQKRRWRHPSTRSSIDGLDGEMVGLVNFSLDTDKTTHNYFPSHGSSSEVARRAVAARRKDKNNPGAYVCEICGTDFTAKHNLQSMSPFRLRPLLNCE
ncbi:hypothetical protein C8R43DRAFT_404139, partial [Mycena crocata]